ncbi:type II toxin-antitoxin system RelE/ParE family toxin [Gracilimonas halophila]|uniref:Type II toxin-antitoxin system RelE/ParE family toxin n=1 Tax=Gracilimonas halophila TaxID=1834464 RepID=A0ABW5JHH8_9BACT
MRVIKFYRTKTGNCPVEDFLQSLPDKQSKKVVWTLRVVRDLEQVPTQYLKKLKSTDDIWEVRATLGNNTFRLLGFFDGPKLIVLTSGFAKKTNKVPKQEIETAEERKRDYYRRKQ